MASSLAKPKEKIQLHVGCGDTYLPGFIHVDLRPLPHVDMVAPADKLGMFDDCSVDLIYNCHVLEHVKRGAEMGVLREWYRVLKPGGVLRTATPDFEQVARWYLSTGDLDILMGLLFGGQTYDENCHGQIFDFKRLSDRLLEVGFRDVRRYDWRQTVHRDYDDFSQAYLPHMDKENGVLMSLNVEASK